MSAPGTTTPLGRQMAAITTIHERIITERGRLTALRKKLTEYRRLASAQCLYVTEPFVGDVRVSIRFDGHKADGPEGRLTEIAGTALHALLSAWLDGEFALLEKQEDALSKRNLVTEVEALLAAGAAKEGE